MLGWSIKTDSLCTGNFVGPLCFRTQDAPRYVPGFIVVVITSLLAGLLIIVYRYVCVRDNRKREDAGIEEGFDHAYEGDLTDKKAIALHTQYSMEIFANFLKRIYSSAIYFDSGHQTNPAGSKGR